MDNLYADRTSMHKLKKACQSCQKWISAQSPLKPESATTNLPDVAHLAY